MPLLSEERLEEGMSTQPEALRLAECLESFEWENYEVARELRRLHAANIDCINQFNAIKAERDELIEAMILLMAGIENSVSPTFIPMVKARAAIAKARS